MPHRLNALSSRVIRLAICLSCLASAATSADENAALRAQYEAKAAMAAGDHARAGSLFGTALRELEGLGPSHAPLRVYPLTGLGVIEMERGHYRAALDLAEQGLRFARPGFGPDAEPTVMAAILRATALDEMSLPAAVAAWSEVRQTLGRMARWSDPLGQYNAYNNLAEFEMGQGELANAVTHHRAAIATLEAFFGPQSEQMVEKAISRINLAQAMFLSGDQFEAENALREAIATLATPQRAAADQALAQALSNLAHMLTRKKRLDDAELMLREAVRRFERRQSPARMSAENNLAIVYALRGKLEQAATVFEGVYRERLMHRWAQFPSQPHRDVADPLFPDSGLADADLLTAAENLAYARMKTARPDDAIRLYRGVFHARQRMTKNSGIEVALTQAHLAQALAESGALREADEAIVAATRVVTDLLAADDPMRLQFDFFRGKIALLAGRPAEALTLVKPYSDWVAAAGRRLQLPARDSIAQLGFASGVHETVLVAAWQLAHGPDDESARRKPSDNVR